MAEFFPTFNEFLPVYRGVNRVWIGDGVSSGTSGMLYAEFADGNSSELGYVTCYAAAQQAGYTGTEREWLEMLMSVSQLVQGTQITTKYQTSESGTSHPSPTSGWVDTPNPEKGKYLWAKIDIKWTAYTPTTVYMVTYIGKDGEKGADGQVQSVNGETGDVFLYGDTILISEGEGQTIKEYIDEGLILEYATNEDIDAMFAMTFFSGAAFITGRQFNSNDSIVYKIEALTANAPLPTEQTITVYPSNGNSCHFGFGHILFKMSDIPTGETQKIYRYKVSEVSHTMDGVLETPLPVECSVTLIDNGSGMLIIKKSENFNSLYFGYEYSASGSIKFEGTMRLDGRRMAAREFMVEIKEQGTENIWENISTMESVAHNVPADIVYPTISYSIADIGVHTYKVKQTSVSGDGVTIDSTVHTIVVEVRDLSPDGELEIITDGSELHVDFVNTYATSGTITLVGTETLVNRLFRNEDSLQVSITGNGKLPSPATINVGFTVGESTADFAFATIQYTLSNMSDGAGGYLDTKVFNYAVTETPSIAGTTGDGIIHSVDVIVTDDKKGHLIAVPSYSDGEKVSFTRTYSAYGSIVFSGEKNLVNRKFVASDSMHVVLLSSNGGKLPVDANRPVTLLVGQNKATFNFIETTYTYADLNGEASYTYHYVITEDTHITGATNDTDIHSLDVYIADNYDGTIAVVPTYSDGSKFVFESVYDATGYAALVGRKSIVNRTFRDEDMMTVAITSNNGNLPDPSSITVPLMTGANTANFSFGQITYKITDLGGLTTATFNYTITETTTMAGTSPVSVTDTVAVQVTDMTDGTLNVVPIYTNGSYASLTNVYTASTDLSFRARCMFTNGNMSVNPFTVKITQVTGNNSTTQATENVVLSAPVSMVANTGNAQDLDFDNIVHFVKNSSRDDTLNSYWFMIEEILPAVDAQGIYNNIKYDMNKKWINVAVNDNFDGTLAITKNPSNSIDMTFTNEQLADLTIAKTWTGDSDRLISAEKNVFTFIVTGPNSYSTNFTYADMVNNSKTLEHLSLGEYTVTETNNTVENFTISTSYSVGGTSTNQISLVRGGGRVDVTDNVNKLEGTLNIVKVWSNEHNLLTAAQKNAVTFTVTGPKQKSTDENTFSQTFTYADMSEGRKTFERLTLGTYTVAESNSNVQDFDVDVTYSTGGVPVNYTSIADSDSKTITIDGSYTLHRGTAKVTKDFTGIPTLPVGYAIENTYNGSLFVYSNADNADIADGFNIPFEWSISNVPVHTTIQFTENNAEVNDYTLEASAVPANRTCAAIVKNETSTVALSNIYTLHKGAVKVTKQFTGITAAQKPADFSITNSYDDSIFTYDNADNKNTADGVTIPYEWTISNVPVHTTVSFTEHNVDIADYSVVASAVPANYTCAAVTKDTTSTVVISNAYTIHKGYAKVTAKFSGITAAQKPADFSIRNNYNATVFTPANADNALSADGITIPYEWTIANVPVHTIITFTENNTSIADHDMTAVTSKTSTEIIKDTITVVDFVNTYEIHTGAIIITALFSGISTLPVGFNITNDYNSDVFTYENAQPGGDGFHISYKWNLINVPVHTVVTFTENNTDITDYDLTSVTVKASAEVPHDNTTDVHFVNTYVYHTGNVRVTKQFVGLTTLPASYSITNDYNDDVFVYANADNAATADGITTPYQWTLTNIPVHTEVLFTENNAEVTDYTLTASASPVNYTSLPVIKNGTQPVSIINSYVYNTGSVKVTKQFIGITAGQKPASFQIANDYNADVFTYANAINVADGIVVPYEWVINNVPVHTNITFTESNEGVTDYSLTPASLKVRQSGSVIKDTEATVNYVNEYTYDTGYIRIYAAFSGTETDPSNFQITNNYNSDVFTLQNGTYTGGALGYYWAIHDVPVHTEVQFTQANYDVNGYTCSHDTITKTCYPVTKDTPSNVYFVNSYTRDTGNVIVSASFSGLTSIPADFSITNNYNESTFTYADADNYSTADGITIPYEWTISDVPTGTTITFTEHDYDVSGYTLDDSSHIVVSGTITVKDSTVNVGFTNVYNPITTTSLVGRTFTFNEIISSNINSVSVAYNADNSVMFTDQNNNNYGSLSVWTQNNNYFYMNYYTPNLTTVRVYQPYNEWVEPTKKTITFVNDPDSFITGVSTIAEFETWLLSISTENV